MLFFRLLRAQLRFDSDLECRFLDALVKLKKMRMARADADPDNFYMTLGRKSSNALDRKKERAELDCCEFFAQSKIDILRDVGEKTEREMNLIAHRPMHAANVRVEIDEKLSN